jgi:hypothetical protein
MNSLVYCTECNKYLPGKLDFMIALPPYPSAFIKMVDYS